MLALLGAVRSSPGTTTTTLAIAGCIGGAVVVEADPDGGVLAPRFGLAREPGLTTFATATRGNASAGALDDHTQSLPGGLAVVVGPGTADNSVGLWRSAGPALAQLLATEAESRPIFVDAGRLAPTAPTEALVAAADLVVVVARPILEDLHAVAGRLPSLRAQAHRLALILVGDRPYGPREIAEQLGADILGVVAADQRAADCLSGRSTALPARAVRISPLARSARAIAERLVESTPSPVEQSLTAKGGEP